MKWVDNNIEGNKVDHKIQGNAVGHFSFFNFDYLIHYSRSSGFEDKAANAVLRNRYETSLMMLRRTLERSYR